LPILPGVLATVLSVAVVCGGALLLGQAVLRLCGTTTWNWAAAPVGLSATIVLAVPALHVPGRASAIAVLLAVLLVAAVALAVRDRASRPPLEALLAAIPLLVLVLVPFASAGYAGTLGVGFNNDMAAHLGWADAYRSAEFARTFEISPWYPLGPHALVAALGAGLGLATGEVFAGLTAAIPILIGLTALGTLTPSAGRPARIVVATTVGMPFLVAGYFGQGSFKELIQILLVLGFALELQRYDPGRGRLRWLPIALMVAGEISVYSIQGLAWPVAIMGTWLGVLTVRALLRGRGGIIGAVKREIVPLALSGAVLVVLLVPQLPRLVRAVRDGTGITDDSLGNLAGPLPFWEAFGIWDSADYRLAAVDPYAAGAAAAIVLLLALAGAVWWIRRGDWVIPATAAACFVLWLASEATQAPYVTAKALVILSPLLILTALRPLVEGKPPLALPRWTIFLGPLVAALLVVGVLRSSWSALRFSSVGPRDHLTELRTLRPLLGTSQTLFLGNDDFVKWELGGVPVDAPVIGAVVLPGRPEKAWSYGRAHDIDSVDSATLNRYRWIITTRDAAGSAVPPQLRLVRRTPSFALYERTGLVADRSLLSEGEAPAAALDCSTPAGRRISRTKGEAGIRLGPVGAEVPRLAPGASAVVQLPLTAGTWDLETPYTSPRPLEITAPGVRTTLPPNLDRPGPRYPIGRLTLTRPATVEIRIRSLKGFLTPADRIAYPTTVLATPDFGEHVVPLDKACGQLVDWYRPAAG
jgi:hypothetical protein